MHTFTPRSHLYAQIVLIVSCGSLRLAISGRENGQWGITIAVQATF